MEKTKKEKYTLRMQTLDSVNYLVETVDVTQIGEVYRELDRFQLDHNVDDSGMVAQLLTPNGRVLSFAFGNTWLHKKRVGERPPLDLGEVA